MCWEPSAHPGQDFDLLTVTMSPNLLGRVPVSPCCVDKLAWVPQTQPLGSIAPNECTNLRICCCHCGTGTTPEWGATFLHMSRSVFAFERGIPLTGLQQTCCSTLA
jgi:hypothetical protein